MNTYKDPLLQRLALDHDRLLALCKQSDLISFEVINPNKALPPEQYKITYAVKSIESINEDQSPNYSFHHVAEIKLPASYPAVPPICYMRTESWHPNIRSSGSYKGRICINNKAIGFWQTLDMLVVQIGEMLQYKNYHALHVSPFPEDPIVAKWVREYAEPQGLLNSQKHIFVDERSLLSPSDEWVASRNKKAKITIISVKQKNKQKKDLDQTKNSSSINLKTKNE